MGDEETVRELMPTYTKNIQEHFDALSEAVKNGNCESIALYAHALRGVGRNLGVECLFDICSQMETAARQDDIEPCTLLWNDLNPEVDKLVRFLSRCDWIQKAKMA